MSFDDHILAPKRSIRHREEVMRSEICGCFFCLATFPPVEIDRWIDNEGHLVGQKAMCPRCHIDSVIGSASGFPITKEFLLQMNAHWFTSHKDDA